MSKNVGGLIWVSEGNSVQQLVAFAFLAAIYNDYMLSSRTTSISCNGKSYGPSDRRKFAKSQTVSIGDLKPEPVLWHKDSKRRPSEYERQNPPGSISGRQLGEAAHRLVVNSLQMRADRNALGGQMYTMSSPHVQQPSYGPGAAPFLNNRYHGQEYGSTVPPRTAYSAQGQLRAPNPVPHNLFDHRQQFAPSASHHQYVRSSYQHERNNHPSVSNGEIPMNGYYVPPTSHQNGPSRYPPRYSTPVVGGGYHHQNNYGSYQGYQAYRAGRHDHWANGGVGGGSGWAPQSNNIARGGYGNFQQGSNQYSALDRGTNRRPPALGYGHQ
ncbi:hypothetical protein Ancab_028644 [Ancistrocladus abbreviatus]